MIAVIADDFTGAAEIGGIGLRYKMKVEIVTQVKESSTADLLIIATDTRSKSTQEAVEEINLITSSLIKLKPDFIYKKVDSVLRGHVIPELFAQMHISKKNKALVVPSNPDIGRIIKSGTYYVNGVELHKTSFGQDPEFPIKSSRVNKILQYKQRENVVIGKLGDNYLPDGIIIGEASTINDMRQWAQKVDQLILAAGSANFFLALLEQKGFIADRFAITNNIEFGRKMVLVCGSAFSKSKELVSKIADKGISSFMPLNLINDHDKRFLQYQDKWALEIISLIKHNDLIIISTDPDIDYIKNRPIGIIRKNMATVMKKVMKKIKIQELMIEGGSTAFAVLDELGFEKFYPRQELGNGVIRMEVPEKKNLYITLKPGSYNWPSSVWNNKYNA